MQEAAEELAPSFTSDGTPDRLEIDTIRALAIDAVEKADSGHPGTPLSMAPVAHTVWSRHLRFDPANPAWPNRDRFILSIGHASMLLYALIHLAQVEEIDRDGYKTGKAAVSLDDVKQFRQLGSKTPGHPEYRLTTGVETTTGPLGQGCGNSVGMAIAEQWLAAHFNRPGFELFDHDIYVLCGDGDMMEGVSSEAASLAGHLKLSNLCWIYDSNRISIEGHTSLAFSEDTALRFQAYGWNVITIEDANDTDAIDEALKNFRRTNDRPTFVLVRSTIAWGSPKADSEKAHGSPLGAEVVAATKQAYGWPADQFFHVPEEAARRFSGALRDRAGPLVESWTAMVQRYKQQYPELGRELELVLAGKLPEGWADELPAFHTDPKGVASRDSAGQAQNAAGRRIPWLVGGSADLAPSTKTLFKDGGSFQPGSYGDRNMHFGVREHGMGSVVNGMTLSGLRGFGATFLVFTDYMRPPIRLAAIMEIPSIFVLTHDSIGVGEDGPTHQPIEHLTTLRAIPGLDVIRPGDANEVSVAWRMALNATDHPTCLILSRQALPTLDRSDYAPADGLSRGGYALTRDDGTPDVILIATGSELSLAAEAAKALSAQGVEARLVSLPSWHRFEKQDRSYRDEVLPPSVRARVAIEQAGNIGWERYIGSDGVAITMSTFGESAPINKLQEKFGFTVDNVVQVAKRVIDEVKS